MTASITRRGALGLIGTSALSLLGAGALAGVILSELYALALEDAGIPVERAFEISGSLIHTALVEGDIDLYPEYTGTGLISVLQMEPITDPDQVYDTVKDEYAKQFDLVWLAKSEAADGQGLVIRTEAAKKFGIETISDLQAHANELRFASQGQFDERSDGLPALEATYGPFDWAEHEVYDEGLKYQVLENDQADVTPAYTTEAQLNARVDIDKEEYEDVARDFFESL